MKRRLGWILLGGFLVLVVGGWLSRLWWLPWLLRGALEGLPLDVLRYEDATWEGRIITLYRVSLYKGRWGLHIDSLWLRLGWNPCLYLGKARLSPEKTLSAFPSQPSPPSNPIKLIQKVLRHLHRIDTLSAPEIILPGNFTASFLKGGDTLRLTLHYDSLLLTFQSEGKPSYYAWEVLPVSFSGERMRFAWNSLRGSLSWRGDTFELSVLAKGFSLYYPRLAAQTLSYDSVGGILRVVYRAPEWYVHFRPRALPLDFTLEGRGVAKDSLEWHLHIPAQPFTAYQQSFPRGFFSVLSQARLEGTSALDLCFTYNPRLPDTLDLQVSWQTEGFRVLSWPPPNPLLLQQPFVYHPWRSQRTILLGPENPKYLTYYQIHPYVLFAILHSEDGAFFYHQGFNKEAFLKAILENWRCKCFRRGAGTITMQLVRNLLLSRQKTLARKVEEICLTALIERFRMLSKQRVLELYLNMVEWGPEVYGLTEASEFYFAKSPHDLTLAEAIFLGLILPSPRNYRYFIDDSTHCARKSLESAFQRVGYLVSKLNFVPEDSLRDLSPSQACLKGPARRIFLPPDSLSEE
jgi:hypothetical protein